MLDTIQDDSQILELSTLVETFQLRQLAAVQDTGADDVDSQVGGSANIWSKRSLSNNSAGLGGTGPA